MAQNSAQKPSMPAHRGVVHLCSLPAECARWQDCSGWMLPAQQLIVQGKASPLYRLPTAKGVALDWEGIFVVGSCLFVRLGILVYAIGMTISLVKTLPRILAEYTANTTSLRACCWEILALISCYSYIWLKGSPEHWIEKLLPIFDHY